MANKKDFAMLVLSRKPPQKGAQPTAFQQIVVDGPAVITILGIQGGNIRVGVEAEPSVSVRRGELPAGSASDEEAKEESQ